jgi:membrane-associated phospholipid phosphatase
MQTIEYAPQPQLTEEAPEGKAENLDLTYRSNEDTEDTDIESGIQQVMEVLDIEMDNKQKKRILNFLRKCDEVDRHFSAKLQTHHSLLADLLLVFWAHFFNRALITVGILLSAGVGFFRYNEMLSNLGYQPVHGDLSIEDRIRYGVVFMLFYGFSLLAMVSSTQVLKYTIRRPRPAYRPEVTRYGCQLRKFENGTFSMPSGDAAVAGVFCYVYAFVAGLPAVYVILPLVCGGRVYYQCHYIGDTIFGSLVGTFWGALMSAFVVIFVPLFRLIMDSPESF